MVDVGWTQKHCEQSAIQIAGAITQQSSSASVAVLIPPVGYAATRLTHPTSALGLNRLGRFNPEPGGVQRRQEQQGQGCGHHQAAHDRHCHRPEEHAA